MSAFNPADFPDTCSVPDGCGSPAYTGGGRTSKCTNPECRYYDEETLGPRKQPESEAKKAEAVDPNLRHDHKSPPTINVPRDDDNKPLAHNPECHCAACIPIPGVLGVLPEFSFQRAPKDPQHGQLWKNDDDGETYVYETRPGKDGVWRNAVRVTGNEKALSITIKCDMSGLQQALEHVERLCHKLCRKPDTLYDLASVVQRRYSIAPFGTFKGAKWFPDVDYGKWGGGHNGPRRGYDEPRWWECGCSDFARCSKISHCSKCNKSRPADMDPCMNEHCDSCTCHAAEHRRVVEREQLIRTQPMDGPTGLKFYFDMVHGGDKPNKNGDVFPEVDYGTLERRVLAQHSEAIKSGKPIFTAHQGYQHLGTETGRIPRSGLNGKFKKPGPEDEFKVLPGVYLDGKMVAGEKQTKNRPYDGGEPDSTGS